MNKKLTIPLNTLYQKLIVLYSSILLIGTVFQYEPPFYILLILSIFTVFFSKKHIDVSFLKQYIFILGFALYGIVVTVIAGGGIGGPLTIVTGLMVCYATQNISFSKWDIFFLAISMIIPIMYWLYRSPTYYSEFFMNQWKGDDSLTNSNGVGHYLAYECSFMIMIMSLSKKKWIQRAKWILAVACIIGCYNVRARMALTTLLSFLLVNYIIERFENKRERIIKIFLLFAVVLEVIFPFFYLWMYKSGIGSEITMFGLAEKSLYSGRQVIWQRAFNAMDTLPEILFGIGSKHDFWTGNVLNMHSNTMNLYVVMGLIGLIIYFSYLIYYIFKNFDFKKSSRFQWQCLIFFISIILEGTTDITIFYNPFLAFYFIPLGIALNKRYLRTVDIE